MSMTEQVCMAKVYIIILNWNGLKDTLECLDSVYRLDYPNYEVILVDNCSSDDSVETIRRQYPQAILIENSENYGFCGGNNIGIKHAMRLGTDYVWLLNNDTVVESDSLTKLVEEAEQYSQTGLVSPVVHYYDSPDKIEFMGVHADFNHFGTTNVMDAKELDDPRVQRNLILWGTALLIKREVIETIGFLSEKYFAYVEDCDYSFRALRANYRARVKLDARIFHKGARTTGNHSPTHVFLGTRNLYFLWRDNVQGLRRMLVPCYYIGMVINYAKCLSDEDNEKSFEACINGFWAAMRGKGGGYDSNIAAPFWIKCVFRFFVSWHPYFWSMLLRFNFREIAQAALSKAKV